MIPPIRGTFTYYKWKKGGGIVGEEWEEDIGNGKNGEKEKWKEWEDQENEIRSCKQEQTFK